MKDLIAEYGGFVMFFMMAFAIHRVLWLMLQVLTTCHWAA